jgi:hypothetical protein
MLRMVFGLGTRAVNRVEGDYPRMVALDDPLKRPYAEKGDLRKYSQHEVDCINIKENSLVTISFDQLAAENAYAQAEKFAVKDYENMSAMSERGLKEKEYWILTLDSIFSDGRLAEAFRKILKTLEAGYDYPVEIEFTVNYTKDDLFKINLLQCRPLQTRGLGDKVALPEKVDRDNLLFESLGYFLGGNISQKLDWVISVNSEKYIGLAQADKYEVARLVGKLNRTLKDREGQAILLMGPGRWGTTTPSLGVPVKFAEINNVSVLTEVAFPAGNLSPELSFGTHFFQDLVETNIFYVAIFPEKQGVAFNEGWLRKQNNLFASLMPESANYEEIIGVYDIGQKGLRIMSDVVSQRIICAT